MKRLQIVIVILIVVLLATALGLLSLLKMAREFPASRPGLAMFHIGYERTADKSQFLMNYQTRLIQHNGYHIPPPVDQFLIGRLAIAADGSDEAMAIIKFYRRTPVSRWVGLGKINDSLKKTLISQLLADQDDDMPVAQDLESTLLQVEFLRRDGKLGKASMSGLETTEQRRLAVRAFKLWWGNGSTWPENKQVNPLEGTGVAVVEP
jgi:hypothetical protein